MYQSNPDNHMDWDLYYLREPILLKLSEPVSITKCADKFNYLALRIAVGDVGKEDRNALHECTKNMACGFPLEIRNFLYPLQGDELYPRIFMKAKSCVIFNRYGDRIHWDEMPKRSICKLAITLVGVKTKTGSGNLHFTMQATQIMVLQETEALAVKSVFPAEVGPREEMARARLGTFTNSA